MVHSPSSPLLHESLVTPEWSGDALLISNPEEPTDSELDLIKPLMASRPPAIASLFHRILPYLNGEYHVDEIIYRENITRKELKAVVSQYRDEIITSLYASV